MKSRENTLVRLIFPFVIFFAITVTAQNVGDCLKNLHSIKEHLKTPRTNTHTIDSIQQLDVNESLCNSKLSYDELILEIDSLVFGEPSLDSLFRNYRSDDKSGIALLTIKIISGLQILADDVYRNLPNDQRLTRMIQFASTNIDLSKVRTNILRELIHSYSRHWQKTEKELWILNLEKILEGIDIENSVTDEIVRRSHLGVIIKKNEFPDLISRIRQNENDEDVIKSLVKLEELAEEGGSRYENPDYSRIRLLINSENDSSEMAYEYFNRANQVNDIHEKINLYNKALEIKTDFPEALHNRAIAYYNAGELKSAQNDFLQYIKTVKNSSSAYTFLGAICQKLTDYNSAVQNYTYALKLEPSNRSNLINRAICFTYLNKITAALEDYERAIQIDPESATAHYNLGCLHWNSKNWEGVISSWRKCIALDNKYNSLQEKIDFAKKKLSKKL